MTAPTYLEVEEKSRISQSRRRAKAAAKNLGFSDVDCERVGIAVTEAVSNVLRHASRGFFLAQPIEDRSGRRELSIIVWDEGPGISNVSQCLKDGYSSAGGQGIGLGAMRRLSDAFGLYTPPSGGLVVSMTFREGCILKPTAPRGGALWDVFGTALSMPGQGVSGDAWAVEPWSRGLKILLVDGLGHGPKANVAAIRAVELFRNVFEDEGKSIMLSLNEALKGTRGAVAAVAEVDTLAGQVRFTGMGNIFGRLINNTEVSQLISVSGTVGYHMRQPRSFEYPWFDNSMIVLHSDGLGSRWDISKYPGALYSRSSVLAGALLGGFRKTTDDCSIVCAKLESTENGEL